MGSDGWETTRPSGGEGGRADGQRGRGGGGRIGGRPLMKGREVRQWRARWPMGRGVGRIAKRRRSVCGEVGHRNPRRLRLSMIDLPHFHGRREGGSGHGGGTACCCYCGRARTVEGHLVCLSPSLLPSPSLLLPSPPNIFPIHHINNSLTEPVRFLPNHLTKIFTRYLHRN